MYVILLTYTMSKINWKLDYTTVCGRNNAGTYTKHLRNWIRRLNIPPSGGKYVCHENYFASFITTNSRTE